MNKLIPNIHAIDLFCGVGGLTKGFERSGIKTIMGVDIDPECEFPYNHNNESKFLLKSVADLTSSEIKSAYSGTKYSLLAGCAPCQPFSKYTQSKPKDERWLLMQHFQRLACGAKPDIIAMENVPLLEKTSVFANFLKALKKHGYHVNYKIICCSNYGVPQSRKRLILLASQLGEIKLPDPSKDGEKKTVRQTIGSLERIKAGQASETDRIHQAAALSELNMERIKASKPGGTWRDWPEELRAACHKRDTGKNYVSVYGRMQWDEVAPTMTTQYFGFGNGRFGHPSQNRAISLREGAMLQSFPKHYKFVKNNEIVNFSSLGRLIGNAVPVMLAEKIGRTIIKHVKAYEKA